MGQHIGRVEDTSAAACNFLVAQTADFVDKLALAAAGIDYMCVRVAESRQNQAALGVDDIGVVGRARVHAAEGCDNAIGKLKPSLGCRAHARGHVGAAQTADMTRQYAVECCYICDKHASTN